MGHAWDQWLLYVKGGAAFARITNTELTILTGGGTEEFGEVTGNRAGWVLGLGLERAMGPQWSWKIEYLYLDFGNQTTLGDDEAPVTHHNRVHTVKFGVNYRFATGAR